MNVIGGHPFYSLQFLRSSTNLFLLNLSVADLLVLVTSCPTSLLENAMKTDAWIFGEVREWLYLNKLTGVA